ncbi:hypothetical protein BJ684DRAFT_19419 [Piptocephalis cylindrospora]|uniref:tRNA-uridine aminocarboxypropyltransferase n=1 Tax=Piptocephalis cylindrospora TaxID=1907219 RepID=A0A4P9Y5W8_9FUNG|nr:hypothetical protein BJ684DRAFT_19419 [Piptocephalis cylindrospora]|eukprot:RKP14152.1 hypothetical protein BJ684DRAFT_19419 [Piptocephalis cylindrospora]
MSILAHHSPADALDQATWLRVLSYLDPPTLQQLCQVSHHFRRLASANHLWKPWTLAHYPLAHPPNLYFQPNLHPRGPRKWKFTISAPEVDPRAYLNTLSSWKATYRADCIRRRVHPSQPTTKPARQKHQLYPIVSTSSASQTTSRPPCTSCGRPIRACLCPILQTIQPHDNATCHILILQHPKCQVSIGTLRILMRAFTHIQTICDVDFSPGRYADAVSWASSSTAPFTSPRTLIAIDGTWSHAKSLLHYNPHLLSRLPAIHLPSPPPSVFGLLKPEPKVHCVSTAEAMAQAIGWVCLGNGEALLPVSP